LMACADTVRRHATPRCVWWSMRHGAPHTPHTHIARTHQTHTCTHERSHAHARTHIHTRHTRTLHESYSASLKAGSIHTATSWMTVPLVSGARCTDVTLVKVAWSAWRARVRACGRAGQRVSGGGGGGCAVVVAVAVAVAVAVGEGCSECGCRPGSPGHAWDGAWRTPAVLHTHIHIHTRTHTTHPTHTSTHTHTRCCAQPRPAAAAPRAPHLAST
jgi:hypothetical protein